ncbi:MAG: MarR family transcriptional regulator [Clostridiaceae bacterium]|nr:MarR family transcriptional regulator [Clostridiaceae bacterium]
MDSRNHVGFEIRTLSNLIRRHVDNSQTIKYINNLTGMHGWIIGYLYDHQNNDIFQRDFENEFSIRRSTATAILQLMEKKELITRSPVKYDARLKKIILTDKAIEIHEMVAKEIDQMEELLTRGISGEELGTFLKIIKKMKKNIE